MAVATDPTQRKQYTPQEAAQLGLGWVDPSNPNYGTAGYVGSEQNANSSAPPPPPGSAPPITTQQQAQNTTAPVGGSIAPGTPTTVAQSYQQALVNKLNPQPLSTDTSFLKPAIDASRLANQRGLENTRNLLAERNAANGTNMSGGFESQLLGAQQGANAQQAQYEGNLLANAQQEQGLNDRAAMAQAAGLLSGNAGIAEQQQLAELDAALRREGLAQQGQLGNADLALRGELGRGQLNLGLLSALLQNEQFGQSLGQNAAQFGASLDQNGLLGLLGMVG